MAIDQANYSRRIAELEARLDRQWVLEAKLIVLEDELNQMKQFRRQVAQETAS
jgi:hypothetical protein